MVVVVVVVVVMVYRPTETGLASTSQHHKEVQSLSLGFGFGCLLVSRCRHAAAPPVEMLPPAILAPRDCDDDGRNLKLKLTFLEMSFRLSFDGVLLVMVVGDERLVRFRI